MSDRWPTVTLGRVLTPASRQETVDAAIEYRLLGIRLEGRGPFLRETLLGAQTSATRLYRVAEGDFIYSRLFACRGAFGVIGKGLDGCYVSGEFPTFVPVPGKVDVEFLKYWFRLPGVIARVDEDCSGSTPLTRNRFKENFFLSLEIPLPPFAEQRRVVARIEELIGQIDKVREVRQQEETEISQMLLAAFHKVCDGVPHKEMRDVAPLVRRPIEVEALAGYPELGIRSFGKGTFHKPTLTGLEIGTKRIFRIEPGDLLFSNVFAWEGAIAVAREEDSRRIGSHRFISCVPRADIATPRFLCFYFLTDEGLDKIRVASPGGALRNRTLGLATLESIEVPVPAFSEQQWFDSVQAEVDELRRLQAETAAELDALLPSILDRAFKGEL